MSDWGGGTKRYGYYEDDEDESPTPVIRGGGQAPPTRPTPKREPVAADSVEALIELTSAGLTEVEAKRAALDAFERGQREKRFEATSQDGAATALVDGAGRVVDLMLRESGPHGRAQWWSSAGDSIVLAVRAARRAAATAYEAAFLDRFPEFGDLRGSAGGRDAR